MTAAERRDIKRRLLNAEAAAIKEYRQFRREQNFAKAVEAHDRWRILFRALIEINQGGGLLE